jgi:hypothetical protein
MAMPEVQQNVPRLSELPKSVALKLSPVGRELTEKGFEQFTKLLKALSIKDGYTYDSRQGHPNSPGLIYSMTRHHSIVLLNGDGDVEVVAPKLEVRHQKNKNKIYVCQSQAREFALARVRLEAIMELEQAGIITTHKAHELAGGKDPMTAFMEQWEQYGDWRDSTRGFQALANQRYQQLLKQQTPVETGKKGGTSPATAAAEIALGAGALAGGRYVIEHAAPRTRKVLYAGAASGTIVSMLLSSCSPGGGPSPSPDTASPPALTQTVPAIETPLPTDFQPTLTPSGPETTPNSPRPYPAALTIETANAGIAGVVDAPPSITGLADVQAIMTKHTQLARDAGLSFDHMAVKYVAADQRWFLVPVQSDGTTISGWLQIADASSQSGWRFGEQPTWDSQYHPSTDTYQYGLPALHDPANHFELGFANGFPLLIEVTSSATPQYWNNIVQKTTLLVDGAVLPTETPIPMLSENPTAQELFAAKQGEVPDVFTFGGHEWTAASNDKGEKVWIREDGKITFEWASLYGGGRYNAYMFVTRSTPVEGKRTLEIYTDPRYPVFDIITGSPDAIDTFIQQMANVMEGDAAQAALMQSVSTLKFIIGGIESWPIGNNSGGPQHIYYYGLNGESLSQKIWGYTFTLGNVHAGTIGPFVEPNNTTVECGVFFNEGGFQASLQESFSNSDVWFWNLSAPVSDCTRLDPEADTPGRITLSNLDIKLKKIISPQLH